MNAYVCLSDFVSAEVFVQSECMWLSTIDRIKSTSQFV